LWDERVRGAIEPDIRERIADVIEGRETARALTGEHTELELGGARKYSDEERELSIALNIVLEFLARDLADENAPPEWKRGLEEAAHLVRSELVYYSLPIVAPSEARRLDPG
jgi:hypothetical protein